MFVTQLYCTETRSRLWSQIDLDGRYNIMLQRYNMIAWMEVRWTGDWRDKIISSSKLYLQYPLPASNDAIDRLDTTGDRLKYFCIYV